MHACMPLRPLHRPRTPHLLLPLPETAQARAQLAAPPGRPRRANAAYAHELVAALADEPARSGGSSTSPAGGIAAFSSAPLAQAPPPPAPHGCQMPMLSKTRPFWRPPRCIRAQASCAHVLARCSERPSGSAEKQRRRLPSTSSSEISSSTPSAQTTGAQR